MKLLTIMVSGLLFFAGCATSRINTEFEFGNKLARNDLWKEAYYRWTKALESGENTAAVHNNIAISLEFQEKLKEAEAEYLKALKLDPGNEYIKRNLSRLKKRIDPGTDEGAGKDGDQEKKREKDQGDEQ